MHPENWEAFQLFAAMATNWRVVGGGFGAVYLGLDYSALLAVMRLQVKGRKKRIDIFDRIRLIEQGALGLINGGEESSNDACH